LGHKNNESSRSRKKKYKMIAIVNYGLGNIRAFVSVYKNLNISCIIAAKADDLKGADKIILPGVGAFDYAMQLLQKSGMKLKI